MNPSYRTMLMGHPVDSISMEEAIECLEKFIESRVSHIVVALNVPKLYRMERDPNLNRIVGKAELILPEKVVVLASHFFKKSLKAYIGNDRLTKLFLSIAEKRGYRLYFLGTRSWILERILQNLRSKYPNLAVAGCHHGFFTNKESEDVVRKIQLSRPDVLFVGMGSPKQEYWMDTYGRLTGAPVIIGVGGTLDLLAGIKREPPAWIRNLGFEWLYRLFEDPRGKMIRYFKSMPWFLWTITRMKLLRIF